jgi:hypothetical protein
MKRSAARAIVVVCGYAALSFLGACGDACGDPSELTVEGAPPKPVVVDWVDSNAMGLYFTEPEAVIPGGPDELVKGKVYWVVEATDFPDGFKPPVTYGSLPYKTKDATHEHGGGLSAEPLKCGVPYKVSVVALGGSTETMVEWTCPAE